MTRRIRVALLVGTVLALALGVRGFLGEPVPQVFGGPTEPGWHQPVGEP